MIRKLGHAILFVLMREIRLMDGICGFLIFIRQKLNFFRFICNEHDAGLLGEIFVAGQGQALRDSHALGAYHPCSTFSCFL
jgi:hypothetical protein